MPFPNIPATWTDAEAKQAAQEYVDKIVDCAPDAVVLAGEFSFVFMVADALIKKDILVLCPCSERISQERENQDGTRSKQTVFDFVRFRNYSWMTP